MRRACTSPRAIWRWGVQLKFNLTGKADTEPVG